jgi:hypothetical protein
MGFLGKVLGGTGSAVGFVSKTVVKGSLHGVGWVADKANCPNAANISRQIGNGLGEVTNKSAKAVGNGLGYTLDKTVEISGKVGGETFAYGAKICGASEKKIKTMKTIGTVVGGGSIGLLTGDLIGSTVSSITAANAVASTGTAISTLHGAAAASATSAAIGGGALAASGGGMAAGQAILTTITATSTTVASVDSFNANEKK